MIRARWQENESRVQEPGLWVGLVVGAVFVGLGLWLALAGPREKPHQPTWFAEAFGAAFVCLGALVLLLALSRFLRPLYVRHAPADILPGVPVEPLLVADPDPYLIGQGLVRTENGWLLRPPPLHLTLLKIFLFGFGIPFLLFFVFLVCPEFYSHMPVKNWPAVSLAAAFLTAFGGTCLYLLFTSLCGADRSALGLNIPDNEADLELNLPCASAGIPREQVTISRSTVVAVQLCPWEYLSSGSDPERQRVVQGLLVLRPSGEVEYQRILLFVTIDFRTAARLLERLAETLEVPFLFHADREGWNEESRRAQARPPLRAGGVVS